MNDLLSYQISLTLFEGVGPVTGKKLLEHFGNIEELFLASFKDLCQIEGLGEVSAKKIQKQFNSVSIKKRVEEEIKFIESTEVSPIFYTDINYPRRLKHCIDGPLILYQKGMPNLNCEKVIGIVGTRNATTYGKDFCKQLVSDLKQHDTLIVSGLAYGIDICAHKAALDSDISTVGVLAHGLDKLYPREHSNIAKEMVETGGLLTEFMSKTNPDRENFPMRNRIVAGLCDAIVVVESASRGGSLITADIANSYNRDVFALPGKINDSSSAGCNKLIKINKASLIESSKDLEYVMGWENKPETKKVVQKKLFVDLNEEETTLLNVLEKTEKVTVDELALQTQMPMSKVSVLLLNLEFNGIVRALPGKLYCLN